MCRAEEIYQQYRGGFVFGRNADTRNRVRVVIFNEEKEEIGKAREIKGKSELLC